VELLYLFPFDSDRKRMSVIIRINNFIKIFCKGADSIIISRLSQTLPQPYLPTITQQLEAFSLTGLRTLCMAMKHMTPHELAQFDSQYMALANAENREEKILELAAQYE